MVFAEVVSREEEVVEVGFGEPIAECRPNAAFCECGYEAELGECTRSQIQSNQFENRANVCGGFVGIAIYRVFLPFGLRLGWRLKI